MTENDWLEGRDPVLGPRYINPAAMLDHLGTSASERKLRLLAAICSPHSNIDFLLRFRKGPTALLLTVRGALETSARTASATVGEDFDHWKDQHDFAQFAIHDEWRKQCAVIREIFGNPFRPVKPESGWLSEDVIRLARQIDEERTFDVLPVMADALMDAGCENEDILSHCRRETGHVPGCWVVDMLLGKEGLE